MAWCVIKHKDEFAYFFKQVTSVVRVECLALHLVDNDVNNLRICSVSVAACGRLYIKPCLSAVSVLAGHPVVERTHILVSGHFLTFVPVYVRRAL